MYYGMYYDIGSVMIITYVIYQSVGFFFFFKQNTAYEMRISDWSSDVCSSDLCAQDFAHSRHASVGFIHWWPLWICALVEQPQGFEIGRASCRERVCQYV